MSESIPEIRQARPEDALRLHELHTVSVRTLCAPHYSPDIIDGWLKNRGAGGYLPPIERGAIFVAEKNSRIIGFGEAAAGVVVAVYVDPSVVRQGVGAAILRRAIEIADGGRGGPITLESTLNASGFYERHGFREIRRSSIKRGPVEVPVVVMEMPAGRAQSTLLVWPAARYLPGYAAALQRGWSADNVRGEAAAREELEKIARDPARFLEELVDREAKGPPVAFPDGSTVPRLPGYRRWLWDGEFCGSIGFRWQPGTSDLPPHCLGHIGFAVVPWKRGKGYATRALKELLPEARAEGLAYVEITTDPTNIASRRVIEANGGRLVERFVKPAQYGNSEGLRFRIELR